MMQDVQLEIQQRTCPNCAAEESLTLILPQYRVLCQACKNYLIDPFAIGPWDQKERVLDWKDGEVVSFYVAPKYERPASDPDQNWIDFMKYLRRRNDANDHEPERNLPSGAESVVREAVRD